MAFSLRRGGALKVLPKLLICSGVVSHPTIFFSPIYPSIIPGVEEKATLSSVMGPVQLERPYSVD